MVDISKKRIYLSAIIPLLVILLLWAIYFLDIAFDLPLNRFGIYPREISGLKGVLSSFFIHANLKHLFANTTTLFILLWILFYFFKDIANIVFPLCIIGSGIVTFLIGRPSYHIGASGAIYALFFFLISSSIFRKNRKLTAISLMAIFLYGGMIWNMIPLSELIDPSISWEGHLSGAICGTLLAVFFRKKGPADDSQMTDEDEDIIESDNDEVPDVFTAKDTETNSETDNHQEKLDQSDNSVN